MNVSELGLWEQIAIGDDRDVGITVWVCCPTNQNAHEKYRR
jgi:hypothetical protein